MINADWYKRASMLLDNGLTTPEAYRDQVLLGELRVDHIDEASLMPIIKNSG